MAIEFAAANLMQCVRRDPFALVIREKQVAVGAEVDAVGRAQADGPRLQLPVRADLDAPTSPRGFRLVVAGEADIERDEKIAVLVPRRAEREFVIVAADAPGIADGLEFVGLAVAVLVRDPRQFGPLDNIDGVIVLHAHAERFMQSGRKQAELDLSEVRGAGMIDQPDFAAPGASQQLAVGAKFQAAYFKDAILRLGDGDQTVMSGLRIRLRASRCRRPSQRRAENHGDTFHVSRPARIRASPGKRKPPIRRPVANFDEQLVVPALIGSTARS